MVDLKNLVLSPESSKQFLTSVQELSAVQGVSTFQRLPGNGSAVPVLGEVNAAFVTRGNKKNIASPTVDTATIVPYGLAVIIPVDNDLLEDLDNLESEIVKKGASAIAREFDKAVIIGDSPGSNFHSFKNADSVTINDKSSFIAALGSVSTGEYDADGIVLSKKLWYELRGSINNNGSDVFDIQGSNETGTIEGIPYKTFRSSESVGVIGAFKSGSVWGTVNGLDIRVSESATYTDSTQNLVSAFETNRTLFRIEARVGFQVIDEDAFVKFGDDADNS